MTELKTGDRARLLKVDEEWEGYVSCIREYVGMVGEYYHSCTNGHASVKFDDGISWYLKSEWLEKVEDEGKMTEFKKGDRVRVLSDDEPSIEFRTRYLNKEGFFIGKSGSMALLRFDDDAELRYFFHEIEKVEDEGKKFDDKKPRWDLLPLDVIEECVKVLTLGAEKYGDDNWKKVVVADPKRYFSATMRHLTAWQKEEKSDPETGISHLAHAICSLVFLLWKEKQND